MRRLCEYKNILGEPNKGVHSYRMCGIAIVDMLLTILGAYFIAKILKTTFLKAFIAFFVLGEFMHWLFCVDTAVIKLIK